MLYTPNSLTKKFSRKSRNVTKSALPTSKLVVGFYRCGYKVTKLQKQKVKEMLEDEDKADAVSEGRILIWEEYTVKDRNRHGMVKLVPDGDKLKVIGRADFGYLDEELAARVLASGVNLNCCAEWETCVNGYSRLLIYVKKTDMLEEYRLKQKEKLFKQLGIEVNNEKDS